MLTTFEFFGARRDPPNLRFRPWALRARFHLWCNMSQANKVTHTSRQGKRKGIFPQHLPTMVSDNLKRFWYVSKTTFFALNDLQPKDLAISIFPSQHTLDLTVFELRAFT